MLFLLGMRWGLWQMQDARCTLYIPPSVWGRRPGPALFAGLSDSRPDVWHVGSSGEGRPTLLHQGKEPRAKSGHFQPSLGSRRARHPDSLSHRLSHPSNSPFPGKMASSNCTAPTSIWRCLYPKGTGLGFPRLGPILPTGGLIQDAHSSKGPCNVFPKPFSR